MFDERPDLGIVGGGGDGKVVFFKRGSNGDVTSVPEPSSIIGISAIAIGLLLKQKKNTKKEGARYR